MVIDQNLSRVKKKDGKKMTRTLKKPGPQTQHNLVVEHKDVRNLSMGRDDHRRDFIEGNSGDLSANIVAINGMMIKSDMSQKYPSGQRSGEEDLMVE